MKHAIYGAVAGSLLTAVSMISGAASALISVAIH
jgi:hypothetical protein